MQLTWPAAIFASAFTLAVSLVLAVFINTAGSLQIQRDQQDFLLQMSNGIRPIVPRLQRPACIASIAGRPACIASIAGRCSICGQASHDAHKLSMDK